MVWQRRYPPLAAIAVAVVLAIFTLPSSLNLPQANPGQLAEYAPVPGNSSAPPGGNFAGLGLGEGGTAEGGGGATQAASGPGTAVATLFNCVGNPPRQTEDHLSPPCVPVFKGDNGGATWAGVTGKQINVVFRTAFVTGNCIEVVAESNNCGTATGYYDMDNPSDVNAYFVFRYLHDWEVYFNRRYQTYGRYAHFWVYNFGGDPNSDVNGYPPSQASREGADNWSHVYDGVAHPFAAFDESGLYSPDYTTVLAQHGAMDFGGLGFTQQLASSYPGLYWSFSPTKDRMAQEYASFVCRRVVGPGHVSFSGTDPAGTPRKYGLLLSDDQGDEDTIQLQNLALNYLQQDCGLSKSTASATVYFHYSTGDATGPRSGWGTGNVAALKAAGVTTIIWPGGSEYEDMRAANNVQWYPEWVILGDGILGRTNINVASTDGNTSDYEEPPMEMSHSWTVTGEPLTNADGYPAEPACVQALLTVDPSVSRSGTVDLEEACAYYDDIRQMFTGVQLAGPRLTPANMDQGFHAIPPKPSTSPEQPACFYLPGDYTCVKDAAAEWWDPNASTGAASQPGCWRMWNNGGRYLVGEWPAGDIMQGRAAGDVCNLYAGGYFQQVYDN